MGISHAAIVPASAKIVVTSGEPGLDLKTGQLVTESLEAQFRAAFDTVDVVLKNAGVTNGLRGAYKFTNAAPVILRFFMAFGVKELAMEGMKVEIRAEAVME
ncbi:hypothetical protein ASPVEDRAFT_83485 [Aspergillus versicolor CBS 583.65]|uniref:Uncharacterized protein n=1 Tax=Aspergillus versicolor CBS 583.65 TaxID=1036611 RepID=A0A1L9PKA9_ASPVE|nr:uncharacterized protein ASPVEDRAFT_83485 [Aspergillus versicolor CBS 583.65]OJJ01964.1 hypothetical protein ASPVEDRAFT_83485 [Aspergillus versicolor CBS 583.65]